MNALFRKNILYLAILLFGCPAAAQSNSNYFAPERHDVGAIGGATFYIGDLKDNTTLFRDASFYGGLLYRYNFNDYMALRGQMATGRIKGTRQRPDLPAMNGSELLEFNRSLIFIETATDIGFLPFDPINFNKPKRWSPYLLVGIGFSAVAPDLDKWGEHADQQTFFGYLMMGLGIKVALAQRITIGAEYVARKTVSDQIDFYNSPAGSWAINKDWVWTIGLSVTYRLNEERLCAAHRKHIPKIHKLEGISGN